MLAALVAVGACGAPSSGDPRAASFTAQAIYGGVEDDDAAANPGVVALRIGDDAQAFELCTGALVAPSVILTARHCVSQNVATTIECDQNGLSQNGAQVGADIDPATLHVFLGPTPDLAYGTPDANGVAIFHPQTTVLCNSDIALVLLDTAIGSVAPMRLRLSAPTAAGETVRAVGYGENDQGLPTGTRFRRDDVPVLAVGPTISASGTPLASFEVEMGEASCVGDSGGPAISELTGAIIGVVSRADACTADYGHTYTLTSGFAELISQALAAVGSQPLDEEIDSDGGAATGSGSSSGSSSGGSVGGDAGGGSGDQPVRTIYPDQPPAPAGCAASVAGGPARSGEGASAVLAALAMIVRAGRRRRRPAPR